MCAANAGVRAITGDDLARRLRIIWSKDPPEAEYRPWRIVALWRVARTFATAVGWVTDEELLGEALDQLEPQPWYAPTKPIIAPGGADGNSTPQVITRNCRRDVLTLTFLAEGLTIMPPERDPDRLVVWCETFNTIATGLGMYGHGHARMGLMPYTDPATAVLCDVEVEDLVNLELALVEEAQHVAIQHGGSQQQVIRHFQDTYCLTSKEVVSLLHLASVCIDRQHTHSAQHSRSWMEAMLHDYLRRARDTMNMTDEMRALKQLAAIQGLTRTLPEDAAVDFFNTIKRVADAADRQLAEGARPAALPEHDEDPDDEALADYDIENNPVRKLS